MKASSSLSNGSGSWTGDVYAGGPPLESGILTWLDGPVEVLVPAVTVRGVVDPQPPSTPTASPASATQTECHLIAPLLLVTTIPS